MESGGGAGGGGRYEEKGGGQQVGSFFEESGDNERIVAVYGNYCFWSWLRYWYIDTENYVMWMLMDKGYYDYDYERPSRRTEAALTAARDDGELAEKLRRMGLGARKERKRRASAEELQRDVINKAEEAN